MDGRSRSIRKLVCWWDLPTDLHGMLESNSCMLLTRVTLSRNRSSCLTWEWCSEKNNFSLKFEPKISKLNQRMIYKKLLLTLSLLLSVFLFRSNAQGFTEISGVGG